MLYCESATYLHHGVSDSSMGWWDSTFLSGRKWKRQGLERHEVERLALLRFTCLELVAADITALDIAHETIILPVLGLADGSPSSTILD